MEIAFPLLQANAMFKYVRQLLDAVAAAGQPVVSAYHSGIKIKFAKTFEAFMAQSSGLLNTTTVRNYKNAGFTSTDP
jgi:L-gulonolactone oxidase